MTLRSVIAFNLSAVLGLLFGAVGSWLYDKMTEPTVQLRRVDTLQAEIAALLLLVLIPTFTALFNLAIGHRIQADTRVSLFLSGVLLIAVAIPLLMILSSSTVATSIAPSRFPDTGADRTLAWALQRLSLDHRVRELATAQTREWPMGPRSS